MGSAGLTAILLIWSMPSASSRTIRIAHLINPFKPKAGSEFSWAQPITIASMQVARDNAHKTGNIEVELLSAQFAGDREVVPEDFVITPDLPRSAQDFFEDSTVPPYPLICDLIERLHEHSSADYLIYTNVDIAVKPHFYESVAKMLTAGPDALIINRRRIPGHYREIRQLPEMYLEFGKSHPGFDCFVFHRSLYPKFQLGHVCVGIPFIGILMAQNLFAYAKSCRYCPDEHLTFHIGEDVFKPRDKVLLRHNKKEFWKAIELMWPDLDSKKWPFGNRWFLNRLIQWGLHPSLPIRLGLKLEWRRWFG